MGGPSDGDMTRQNQPVQPSPSPPMDFEITRPEESNLHARGHSEVAQSLNSELKSSPVQKNTNQIKTKKPQNQIKTKKSQTQIKTTKSQNQIKTKKSQNQ